MSTEAALLGTIYRYCPLNLQVNLTCGTTGVYCDAQQHVTRFNLDQAMLEALPYRQKDLQFWCSHCKGYLPSEFGSLSALESLDLEHHKVQCLRGNIHGSLPSEFDKLATLTLLRLGVNHIGGTIPCDYGRLQSVAALDFGVNQLEGSIPSEFGNLQALDTMWFDQNRLVSQIPSELARLCNLYNMDLSHNKLAGNIPTAVGAMVELSEMTLRRNKLTGQIPSELARLCNLYNMDLSGNKLAGNIPGALGAMAELWPVDLSRNKLTGSVPIDPVGREFSANHNSLSGSIPSEWARFRSMLQLEFEHNRLVGVIPSELSQVNIVCFGSNTLEGTIPTELAAEIVYFDHNRLTGRIPSELATAGALELGLAANSLTGSIPSELCKMPRVIALSLGHNALIGSIRLGCWPCVGHLFLHANRLQGDAQTFAKHWGGASYMEHLTLHENRFGGSLPPLNFSVSRGWTPIVFTMHSNHISCALPNFLLPSEIDVIYKSSSLVGNRIVGPMPAWIPKSERDPILYRSPFYRIRFLILLAALLGMATTIRCIIGRKVYALMAGAVPGVGTLDAPCNHNHMMAHSVVRISVVTLFGFMPAYLWSSKFTQCSNVPPTLADLGNEHSVQCIIGGLFVLHYSLCFVSLWHQSLDNQRFSRRMADSEASGEEQALPCRLLIRLGLAAFVLIMSSPSVMFAFTRSLPKENLIAERWGHKKLLLAHYAAAVAGPATLELVAPKLTVRLGRKLSFDPAQLMVWCQVLSCWGFPALMVIIMDANCYSMWRKLWVICQPDHEGHTRFDVIAQNGQQYLSTDEVCASPSFSDLATNGKCGRAVIETIDILICQKMVFASVLPWMYIWLWCLCSNFGHRSSLADGFFGGRLRRGMEHVTQSVADPFLSEKVQRRRHSLWLQLSMTWGPLIPASQILLLLSWVINFVIHQIGKHWFRRLPPECSADCSSPDILASVVIGFLVTFCLCCNMQMWWCTLFLCATFLLLATMHVLKYMPVHQGGRASQRVNSGGASTRSFKMDLELQELRTVKDMWYPGQVFV